MNTWNTVRVSYFIAQSSRRCPILPQPRASLLSAFLVHAAFRSGIDPRTVLIQTLLTEKALKAHNDLLTTTNVVHYSITGHGIVFPVPLVFIPILEVVNTLARLFVLFEVAMIVFLLLLQG